LITRPGQFVSLASRKEGSERGRESERREGERVGWREKAHTWRESL